MPCWNVSGIGDDNLGTFGYAGQAEYGGHLMKFRILTAQA